MRKLFTEPLIILLSIQMVLVGILCFKPKILEPLERKRVARASFAALLILWIISVPVVCNLIERGLCIDGTKTADEQHPVEAIAVLAGGYHRETDARMDFLSDETTSRVLHGIEWWRKIPQAKFIVTGASTSDDVRPSNKEAQMMGELAARHGVAKDKIILEMTAKDTSEHPTAILKLKGITRATHLGIVTSPWHMRRAMLEFGRHFEKVSAYAYPKTPLETEYLESYFPRRSALGHSTTLMHEWIGMLWSYLR